MSIVRGLFYQRLKALDIEAKIINSVHDSIVVDTPEKNVDILVDLFYNVYMDVPNAFQKLFGVEYNLPLFNEVSVGPNLKDLEEIKR